MAICKNCGAPFEPAIMQQRHCKPTCRIAQTQRYKKLRYRNDPAYREKAKADALDRYHRRIGGARQ